MRSQIQQRHLLLPESQWRDFVIDNQFGENDRRWISEWEMHELTCPPDNDEQRKHRRLGHHVGWFNRGDTKMIDQFSIIPHLNKSDQEWAEFVASSTFDDVCTAWLHAWTFHSLVFLADLVKQPYRCMHFLGFTTALQYINLTKVAPCCICGRGFSIGEITSAVTAGVGKNHEQLTAHKACWENKAK